MMLGEVRRHERVRLRAMIDQRLNVAVTGGPGMGKTALVDSVVRDLDAVIVRVPCSHADSQVPLSGVRVTLAALRALGDRRLVEDLEAIAETERSTADRADLAVERLLATSFSTGVLIVIDGIDLMDVESQEIIGHMLRRMSSSPMRAVVTARRLDEGGPLGGVPLIELAPLDRATSIAVAHEMVEETLSEDAAATAAAASGGNPESLRHVLTTMTARQRCGEAPFPRPVRTTEAAAQAVLTQVADVSDDALEILRIVALAPLTPTVALQRRYMHVWEEVSELLARGVLEQERSFLLMGDQLLRSALYWGLSAAERGALRAALVTEVVASKVHPSSPEPEDSGPLREGPSAGSPVTVSGERRRATSAEAVAEALTRWHRSFTELAVEAPRDLLTDARNLILAGHSDAGVSFAERALTLAPDPLPLARELVGLAEALALRGDTVFALRYIRFARETEDTALQLRALSVTVQAEFFRHEEIPTAYRHLWSEAEVEEAPDAVARLQLVLSLCHAERFELAEAQELLASAEQLRESFSRATRAVYESACVMLDGYRGKDERALEMYRALVAPRRELMPAFTGLTAARALTFTEHFAEAQEVFELIERRLAENSVWRPIVPLLRAELEVRIGNLHRVPELIDQANRRRIPGEPTRELQRLHLECWRLYARGRQSDAADVERTLVRRASATGHRGALALLSALQGAHLLSVGLPAEAVRHLQRCDELAPGDIDPTVIRHEPELIEALIRVGRREHAVLVLQRFRSRLTRFPSRWGELAAQRCEALLADGAESLEIFRRVLRGWRPIDSDHEKARTLEAYAQRLRDLGAASDAAEPLLQARTLYERTGDAVRLGALSPTAVRDVPATPPVRGGNTLLAQLTEEERSVVDLVREGLRNREIAERIYVSLRTVEIRLTGVYRRFGVRSRTELLAKLSEVETALPG